MLIDGNREVRNLFYTPYSLVLNVELDSAMSPTAHCSEMSPQPAHKLESRSHYHLALVRNQTKCTAIQ